MKNSPAPPQGAKGEKREASGPVRERGGLTLERRWTTAGNSPYDDLIWERRCAVIKGADGEVVFEQDSVEVPAHWSESAIGVVVSRYFRGALGTPERETSVRQLIDRVVNQLTGWGRADGYFGTEADGDVFRDELCFLLVNQYASFNSPVWFNAGLVDHPQCSACFINSVEDTMPSILELARTEGMLFRYGSGTGTNFSPIRASTEGTRGGGIASGPVSFIRGYDAFASVIKSGGTTRRAARMVVLDIDHPDIEAFVQSKSDEEKKARALIEAGYDSGVDGEAYGSISLQNGNHSVRVSDEFMAAVEHDGSWSTINRTDGAVARTYRARELMTLIAGHAHQTGDPGLQYDTTINKWHTCKATDRIYASNPCSEYMFLNDSACNLASLNLMKFRGEGGDFDSEGFKSAIDLLIIAGELIVSNAGYPTERIELNSHRYRPLGLGYANLGALLMSLGLPYDSEEARGYAAGVTALMTGEAYAQSARIAAVMGPFEGYSSNLECMEEVLKMHRDAVDQLVSEGGAEPLNEAARAVWTSAVLPGSKWGYRNAQVTALAPTGTIGFMMDCDTLGIEPDLALVKYKTLAGGGTLKIVNQTVPLALSHLGYGEDEKAQILRFLEEEETLEGAPGLGEDHLAVFDCAFRSLRGSRAISPMGHVMMMAAVQPFLSGGISKTVNLPAEATVTDILDVYVQAWRSGLKSIAVYRDGCKHAQPLNTGVAGGGNSTNER